jgi:uncharacterized membrane protein
MYCHSCGAPAGADLSFCPRCGAPLGAPAGAPPPPVFTPRAGIHAQTGRWISEAWRLVQSDLGAFVLVGLVFMLLSGVPLIQGPLTVGFHIFCIKKLNNRPAEFADLFAGFSYFVPALVASLLIAVFTGIGLLACLVGAIVVAAALHFTYVFIADKRMDFWPAMQASHAVVKNDYFGFTMFLIVLFLVNVLGAICCLVGLLISVPVSIAAVTVAYRDCVGFEPVQTL